MSYVRYLPLVLLFIVLSLFLKNIQVPLQGIQKTRQADTLMTAVMYCYENAPFLEPRVSFRGGLEKGISIGEFPLYSYILSLPCKATGVWSEVFPKVFTYLCFLIGLLLWTRFLFPKSKEKRQLFALLSFSISAIMTFTLIVIPDAFVFLLFAIAVTIFGWRSRERLPRGLKSALGLFLLTLGFLIRPYFVFLIPYLFWVTRDRRYLYSLVPFSIAYWWWYKTIVLHGDLINYYYTGMPTLTHMLTEFIPALKASVYYLLRDQVSFFGAIFIAVSYRKNKIVALYALACIIAMHFLRGQFLGSHQYYLFGVTLILLHLATEGATLVSPNRRAVIISLMFCSLIISDQHHWHAPRVNVWAVREDAAKNTTFKDRICTKNFGLNEGLYYALRTGWSDVWVGYEPITYPKPQMVNTDIPYECPAGAYTIDRNNYIN